MRKNTENQFGIQGLELIASSSSELIYQTRKGAQFSIAKSGKLDYNVSISGNGGYIFPSVHSHFLSFEEAVSHLRENPRKAIRYFNLVVFNGTDGL